MLPKLCAGLALLAALGAAILGGGGPTPPCLACGPAPVATVLGETTPPPTVLVPAQTPGPYGTVGTTPVVPITPCPC